MGRLFYLIIFLLGAGSVNAETVTIAAASNFTAPLKDISSAFEAETGHKLRLISGSSGQLFAQIIHGAPFDIFLSADQQKPKALEEKGLTVSHSRFTYALGSLVLWSPDAHGGDVLDILKKGQYHKLAVASPALAPYGVAAREVLKSLGLYQAALPKLILGENIAQTYQFVATGNGDLGFIARSQLPKDKRQDSGGKNLAKAAQKDSVWFIPENLYTPIRQDGVILKRASGKQAVFDFIGFMRSEKAIKIMEEYGYKIPMFALKEELKDDLSHKKAEGDAR